MKEQAVGMVALLNEEAELVNGGYCLCYCNSLEGYGCEPLPRPTESYIECSNLCSRNSWLYCGCDYRYEEL